MKVLIDACVLYPTVLREIVVGCAKAGLMEPVWSPRILEEWARAVARNIPDQAAVARGEIAMLRAHFPTSEIDIDPNLVAQLYLPDPDDRHVLAAAIGGGVDGIMTQNLRDFPASSVNEFAIWVRSPDQILRGVFDEYPDVIDRVVSAVHQRAVQLSGQPIDQRKMLKKARLPRLAKALVARG